MIQQGPKAPMFLSCPLSETELVMERRGEREEPGVSLIPLLFFPPSLVNAWSVFLSLER